MLVENEMGLGREDGLLEQPAKEGPALEEMGCALDPGL